MNKYFIGFEMPAHHRLRLVKAQQHVRHMFADSTRVLGMDEFHVTSLFLGKCPRGAAESIVNQLAWGFGSIYFRFDGLEVFEQRGKPHALVLKLHDLYGNAQHMHRVLRDAAVAHPNIAMQGKSYPYNPHITLAKCEGQWDATLPIARDIITESMEHNITKHEFHVDHLVLFEKVDGTTAYEPHRMLQLR